MIAALSQATITTTASQSSANRHYLALTVYPNKGADPAQVMQDPRIAGVGTVVDRVEIRPFLADEAKWREYEATHK